MFAWLCLVKLALRAWGGLDLVPDSEYLYFQLSNESYEGCKTSLIEVDLDGRVAISRIVVAGILARIIISGHENVA